MADIQIDPILLDNQVRQDDTEKISVENVVVKQLLDDLGAVGHSIVGRSNDTRYQTDYFLGREALNDILAAIQKLEIDAKTQEGLSQLVEYLRKKIDKRINADNTGGTLD